jgi:diguanylate cyclase (GGDEF)-like protein
MSRVLDASTLHPRVLIVDANRIDAERSRNELRRTGVASEVRTVADLAELQSALESFVPDVVISELTFPDFDGTAVHSIVRDRFPDAPFIFVSNVSDDEAADGTRLGGTAEYVSKAALFRLARVVERTARDAAERRRLRPSTAARILRSRQHDERLVAIWRIVNDPQLSGDALVSTVLGEAVAQLAFGGPHIAMLAHLDGEALTIDAVAGERGPDEGPARALLQPGRRVPAETMIRSRDIGAGRTASWDDLHTDPSAPAHLREAGVRGWLTTQFVASGVIYVLGFGSFAPRDEVPFGAEDYAYAEVIGSILGRQLEREQYDAALRDAELHARRHRERTDAIWRLVDTSTLEGHALLTAMLVQAAKAIEPRRTFDATLGHIDGEFFVLDAVSADRERPADGAPIKLLRTGMRVALHDTLNVRDLAAARTQSWTDCQSLPDLPERLRRAGLVSELMTQFPVNGVTYVLTFRLFDPPVVAFSSEDHEYAEVLGSLFARQLELAAMESSLRDAELRSRRHAQRLDAMWRIVGAPLLRGNALTQARLEEAIEALRDGEDYVAVVRHIEGTDYVIDVACGDLGAPDSERRRLFAPGLRIPFDGTVHHRWDGPRTQSWMDLQTLPDLPPRVRAVGWRRVISTGFEAAGKRYEVTIGSLSSPAATPFSAEDHEYLEVLASILGRQFERERMESSLSAAELRSRQHAERLEVLWRIANDPRADEADTLQAMLRHGALAIRPGQRFIGVLGRIEGSDLVIVAEETTPNDPEPYTSRVGRRIPLATTLVPQLERTQTWDDLQTVFTYHPTAESTRAWRGFIATPFEAGGARYTLAFASTDPASPPFDADDESYIEVLASSFASRLQVDRLEDSLREAEARSRQHAERLEALWQIVNNANLRDDELLDAMLRQAAAAIQPGQDYEASLLRADGDDAIVEATAGPPGVPERDLHFQVGTVVPLATTLFGRVLAGGGGTRSWDDIEASAFATPETRSRGTRSMVISTFTAGGSNWALEFTSARTSRKPLGPQDHSYIEVVVSFFANHVHQRWQFDRIRYQQSHDVLTGLLNRSTFRSRARTAARTCERYAVIIIDVDGLHEINESYGHIIGDAVLVEVASALGKRAVGDEIVGRLGGDVFAVYVPDLTTPQHLAARVNDFREVFARPFSTGDRAGNEFVARSACIGIATAPGDGNDFEAVLAHADAALYTAQERGHGTTVAYVAGMEAEAQRRTTLQNELREAIAGDQFELYFQPHLEIATGRVTGCEALIRWNHPTRGVLAPAHFIPFAEQTGFITTIDEWVMRNAFVAASELAATHPGFRLYFNLSGRQAGDPKLVRAFTAAARNGLSLSSVGVEITETDAMRDVDSTRHVCRALRRLDVRIAIDDFGTGYSSLSSLKRLPVDIVKIDRAFVSGVLSDPHDGSITETIISIAGHFGFETLAEGAESDAELDWLRERACRYVQGYAVCHPLPLADFRAWMAERD